MLPVIVPLFLLLASPAAGLGGSPLGAPCEDTERFELRRATGLTREICVSPGTMTGMLFDTNVVVDIQDEGRFVEVTRGRNGVSFVPPADMLPGERLRITATVQGGDTHQSVTFALVAHVGRATHQVNIYHDPRTWQSLRDEVDSALLRISQQQKENDALREELSIMKAELADSLGLRGAYASGYLRAPGILTRLMDAAGSQVLVDSLKAERAVSYRSEKSVGVEVWVSNTTSKPWTMSRASLVTPEGKTLRADRIWQETPLLPGQSLQVFVEFDALTEFTDSAMLHLWDDGSRVITVPGVLFP